MTSHRPPNSLETPKTKSYRSPKQSYWQRSADLWTTGRFLDNRTYIRENILWILRESYTSMWAGCQSQQGKVFSSPCIRLYLRLCTLYRVCGSKDDYEAYVANDQSDLFAIIISQCERPNATDSSNTCLGIQTFATPQLPASSQLRSLLSTSTQVQGNFDTTEPDHADLSSMKKNS